MRLDKNPFEILGAIFVMTIASLAFALICSFLVLGIVSVWDEIGKVV